MHTGVVLPRHRWEVAVAWARRAESLGVASVWLVDHDDRDQGAGGPGLEPLTALAGLARATTRLRLGALLTLSWRPPAVTAKALATIDRLSAGRLAVAVTVGREEAGPSVGTEQLGEAVQIVQGAFGGGPFTFEGSHYRVEALRCRPRPLQQPRPPVWVAGGGEVLGVAARHADGWVWDEWGGTLDAYRSLSATLERDCEELGRDPSTLYRAVCLRALVGTHDQVREQVVAWEGAGVAMLIVHPGALAWSSTSGDDLDLVASAVSSETQKGAP